MTALCNICKNQILSFVLFMSDGIYLSKVCPQHGKQLQLIEPDISFYKMLKQGVEAPRYHHRNNVCLLDVATTCNMRCKFCYQSPTTKPNKPLEQVLEEVRKVKHRTVFLMGAEPTTRQDLPDVVREITKLGKRVFLFTNGLKLAERAYTKQLKDAGLKLVEVSVDVDKPKKQIQGAKTAVEEGLSLGSLSFTLNTLSDWEKVEAVILQTRDLHPFQYRIRLPAELGNFQELSTRPWLSDLYNVVDSEDLIPGDNNLYHVNVRKYGQRLRLIRWPDSQEVNLDWLDCGPYALFNADEEPSNFVTQVIMKEIAREKNR